MQKEIEIKTWGDLTIKDVKRIFNIQIPDELLSLYKSKDENEYVEKYSKFNEKDFIKFGIYYGKIIEIMTNIPINEIQFLQWWDRQNIYENYCQKYIIDLISEIPGTYKPKNITHFIFKDIRYELPTELKLLNQSIPAYQENALTFTEGATLYSSLIDLQNGGVDKLPFFIAVYCRKKNESYDENTTMKRAEVFENLTMDIAWEVFFCILRLLKGSKDIIAKYLKKEMEKEQKNLKKVN